jgi:hypothetical protein
MPLGPLNRPAGNHAAPSSSISRLRVVGAPRRRAAAPRSRAGVMTLPSHADDRRARRDRTILSVVVGGFLLFAIVLMSISVSTNANEAKAKAALDASFKTVHIHQSEFRTLFGRFATWPELSQRGVEIGPRQTVRESNADASHWFISLRDQGTGLICDRTGELFDEDSKERASICRPAR